MVVVMLPHWFAAIMGERRAPANPAMQRRTREIAGAARSGENARDEYPGRGRR